MPANDRVGILYCILTASTMATRKRKIDDGSSSGTSSSSTTNNNDESTSSSQVVQVTILGDAFADLFCYIDGNASLPSEPGGDTRLSQPITTVAGGSGLNTATHYTSISNNSCNVSLYSAFNEHDTYGQLLCHHAKQHNFQLINCCSNNHEEERGESNGNRKINHSGSTGHCAVLVTNGERSFLTHLGVMGTFQAQDIDVDRILCNTNAGAAASSSSCNNRNNSSIHIVHVAGYFNIPGFWNNKLTRVLQDIKKRLKSNPHTERNTVVVSLLPQYDATEQWDGQIVDILPEIDYLFVNLLEAANIAKIDANGNGNGSRGGGDDYDGDHDESLYLADLATFYYVKSPTTCVVITMGSKGACAMKDGKVVARQLPPIQLDTPLDPTGAGDAFIAGFLHGITTTTTTETSTSNRRNLTSTNKHDPTTLARGLLYGCVLGTSCAMRSGASVPASKEEINKLLLQAKQK